jgi:hypothetical protein
MVQDGAQGKRGFEGLAAAIGVGSGVPAAILAAAS